MDSFDLDENEVDFIEDDDWAFHETHLEDPSLFGENKPQDGFHQDLSNFGAVDYDDDFSEWVTPPEIRERIQQQLDASKAAGGSNAETTSVHKASSAAVTDSAISRIGLSHSDKAGMENVDLNKANQIIYEMSKNSKFFLNEKRKEEQVKLRIDQMLKQMAQLPELDATALMEKIDKKIASLEALRDLSSTWIHIDMDAFYASVEIRDDPSLKGKPIGVGDSHMLTTASYEARKFGVRSAMPGFIAKQLCPELIFVRPNFHKYKESSRQTREVMALYDPNYEPYSLDEAALDLTNYLKQHPGRNVEEIAEEIQAKIFEKTKLTCSIGIGPNKRLAKMCADVNKPNGKFRLVPDRQTIIEFVQKQPCRKINGIGKVMDQMLKALGVHKVADLFDQRLLLFRLFSADTFEFFMKSALGIGSTEHSARQDPKSVGTQRTFRALSDRDQLLEKCRQLSDEVHKTMLSHNLKARKVTLFFKTTEFEMRSKTQTLKAYTDSYDQIYDAASRLLVGELPISLRLLGVRVSDFPKQIVPNDEHQRKLSQFFGKNSSTKSSIPDTLIDPNDQDIFEEKQEPASAPAAPKRGIIASMFASASQRSRKEQEKAPIVSGAGAAGNLESEIDIQMDSDDDIAIIGSTESSSKKRPAVDPLSSAQPPAKRSKLPTTYSKRKGQPTLETFLKPGS